MAEEPRFRLKEIRIPIELFINDNLSPTDHHVFSIIHMLDGEKGCYASNTYIAFLLRITERQVTKSISALKENKYIYQESFDGRTRVVRVNLKYPEIYKEAVDDFYSKETSALSNCSVENRRVDQGTPVELIEEIKIIDKDSLGEKSFLSEKTLLAPPTVDRRKQLNRISRADELKKQEEITKKKEEEKNKLLSFKPSSDAKTIVDIWNKQEINGLHLVNHNEGTKTFKKISETIDRIKSGKFFRDKELVPAELRNKTFTLNKIETSIERFALAALDDTYEPSNKEPKKKISLLNFFYNPFSASEKLEWRSPFLYYLLNEPKKLNERLVKLDETTEVAEYIGNRFRRLTKKEEITTRDKINIARCIERCTEFVDEFKENIKNFDHHKMTCDFGDDETMIAKYVLDSLDDAEWIDNVTSGHLCSDYMFKERLFEYLREIGQWRT